MRGFLPYHYAFLTPYIFAEFFPKLLVNARRRFGGCRTSVRVSNRLWRGLPSPAPLVTIVIRSLMAPRPLRSPKYRPMFAASIGGATKAPPRALATSPSTPPYCLVRVVQMSAKLYSTACRPRGSELTVSSLFVCACYSSTRGSARDRRSDSPLASRERADPLPVRESTGPNMYWATRGQRGSVWPCSAGPRLGPAECM